jgi:hypothetical protein
MEIGLALFIVTIIVNALPRYWSGRSRADARAGHSSLRNCELKKLGRLKAEADAFKFRAQMRTLTDGAVTALAVLATAARRCAAGGHLRLSAL